MSDQSEIEAAARNLVSRFGEDAAHQADVRIAELQQHGETEGLAFWRRVREIVQCLLHGRDSTKH